MLKAPAMLLAVVSLCLPLRAAAQTDPQPSPASDATSAQSNELTAEQLRAVQRWTREYADWKAWFARWRNRAEHGWLSTRPRRQPPAPPVWLPDVCASLLGNSGPLADGCRAFREWSRNDPMAVLLTEQTAQTRADLESPRKSVWWEHIHLDALWPMTQTGSHAYGVFGMHTTLPLTARVQVFLAPGVIMMRLPSAEGGQTWSTAADWGFSYRMCDFRMPVTRRGATLNLNLARVWVLGASGVAGRRELYLAGFSVNFKPSGSPPNAR